MLQGEPYNSRDPELLKQYHTARGLLKRYNSLDSENGEERRSILQSLFESYGLGVWIEIPFFCDYGEHISIGENTFINAIFVGNVLFCNYTRSCTTTKIEVNSGKVGPDMHTQR